MRSVIDELPASHVQLLKLAYPYSSFKQSDVPAARRFTPPARAGSRFGDGTAVPGDGHRLARAVDLVHDRKTTGLELRGLNGRYAVFPSSGTRQPSWSCDQFLKELPILGGRQVGIVPQQGEITAIGQRALFQSEHQIHRLPRV